MNQFTQIQTCKKCSTALPELQIKNLGNLEYNEWFRAGYCSHACWATENTLQAEITPSRPASMSSVSMVSPKVVTAPPQLATPEEISAFACPRCTSPMKKSSYRVPGGGTIPALIFLWIQRTFGLHRCEMCGLIPFWEFPEEDRRQLRIEMLIWGLGSLIMIPLLVFIAYLLLFRQAPA
jgi:hypothetical protein